VSIAGVATFGTLSVEPQKRLNKMFQIVDSLSHQRRRTRTACRRGIIFNDDLINYPGRIVVHTCLHR